MKIFEKLGLSAVMEKTVDEEPLALKFPKSKRCVESRFGLFEDLKKTEVFETLERFVMKIDSSLRKFKLSENSEFKWSKIGWYLEAVLDYTSALFGFIKNMEHLEFSARILKDFFNTLRNSISYDRLIELKNRSALIKKSLRSIRFEITLEGNKISISNVEETPVLEEEAKEAFEDIIQIRENHLDVPSIFGTSKIENSIVEKLTSLFPETFQLLNDLYRDGDFIEEYILNFAKKMKIFLRYKRMMDEFEEKGLKFSIPRFGDEIDIRSAFDLSLVVKNEIVTNDLKLKKGKKIVLITGPSGSGKSSFLRSVGQVFLLAKLGFPVPAASATVPFVDAIFHYSPEAENVADDMSALEKDLMAIKSIVDKADANSVIFLDEPLSSTSAEDASFLMRKLMNNFLKKGSIVFWVSFFDEVADTENVAFYHPFSKYAFTEGRMKFYEHASSILKKFGLDYAQIVRRFKDGVADEETL